MTREPFKLVGKDLQRANSIYQLLSRPCHLLQETLEPGPKTLKMEPLLAKGELMQLQ
jgi:hypothetical protein